MVALPPADESALGRRGNVRASTGNTKPSAVTRTRDSLRVDMLTDPPSGSCRVKRPRSPSTAASPPGPTGPTSGGLCGCLRRGDGGHFHEDDQGCRRGGDAGGPAVDGAPAAVESSQTDPVQLHLGSTVLELLERSEDAVDVLRWWGVPVVDRPRPRTATTAAAMLSPASVAGQQDSPEHHVHPRRRQGAGQTTSCPSRHGRPVCDTAGCGHHDRSSPNPQIGAVAAQLAAAFLHDPVMCWMWPMPQRRLVAMVHLFTAQLRYHHLPGGGVSYGPCRRQLSTLREN